MTAEKLLRVSLEDMKELIAERYEIQIKNMSVAYDIVTSPEGLVIDVLGVEVAYSDEKVPEVFKEVKHDVEGSS